MCQNRPGSAAENRNAQALQTKDCEYLTPFGSDALQDADLLRFLEHGDDQDRSNGKR